MTCCANETFDTTAAGNCEAGAVADSNIMVASASKGMMQARRANPERHKYFLPISATLPTRRETVLNSVTSGPPNSRFCCVQTTQYACTHANADGSVTLDPYEPSSIHPSGSLQQGWKEQTSMDRQEQPDAETWLRRINR